MSTIQPQSTDPLNAPDHSLVHRQIAADTSAPVKSIDLDANGAMQGGTPLFQNLNPTNLLTNGDFENWTAGTSSAPDGWGELGGTVARETSIIKLGTYSMKLTNTLSANAYVAQYLYATKGIAYWQGRKLTFGCWVYASAANRVKIMLRDNVTTAEMYHSGSGSWEFLTATLTVASNAGTLYVEPVIAGDGSSISAYFDGAIVVEGSSAFAFSDKPVSLGGRYGTFVANGVTPVTITNANVAITDCIVISLNTVGGTVGVQPHVATITAGTGFTVVCTALDTSTYNYCLIKQ